MTILFDLVRLVLAVQVPREAHPHAPARPCMITDGLATPNGRARP